MGISAKDVMKLRKATGSPMMDCKKVLKEAEGDMEKAVELLRQRGIAKAAKRADNETKEGLVFAYSSEDNTSGAMFALTCETEPVSAVDEFKNFGNKTLALIKDGKIAEIDSEEFKEELVQLRAKLGENIDVVAPRLEKADFVATYVHSNNKVGVLISLKLADSAKSTLNSIEQLAKDLTLQIASMSPIAVDSSRLDPDYVTKELAILKGQLKEDPKMANKPEEILDKIIEGRKTKMFAEVCLLDQEFVKEKMIVRDLIASVEKETGTSITVTDFYRYDIAE